MFTFLRTYPCQTLVMLLALLLAGLAEGIGLSALLPLLNIAVRNDKTDAGGLPARENDYERLLNELLDDVGISPGIGAMLATIVMAITLKNFLLLIANRQVGYTAAHVATDLRLKLLRAVLNSRWEYLTSQPIGGFANALATEAQRSSQAFVNGSLMITFAIQALIYGLVAVAVSWKAALVSLITGLLMISAANALVRMSRKAGKKQTSLLTSLAARLTGILQSVKPLKAMARENRANAVLTMETSRLNRALQQQVFSTAVLGAVQEVLLAIAIAVGMFVALVQFEMPFTTVLVLVVVLGRMLRQFSKVQREYQKVVIGGSAYWSIQNSIDQALEAREAPGSGRTPSLETGIRIDAIRFGYSEHRVLDGLTLEIPAGSLTTLAGPSGAGKTTLVDLITGLLQPQSGTIYIDNIPMAELDIKSWRKMIGYVPQETLLLHDTIRHNVTLDDPGLPEVEAERALKQAGAWDFVAALPKGMDTIVGERGEKLSGGQRQRIVIARALAQRPKLLILDEATSALDPEGEATMRETTKRLRGKLTLLAISHRAALVDPADRVYRLEDGRAFRGKVALLHAVGGA